MPCSTIPRLPGASRAADTGRSLCSAGNASRNQDRVVSCVDASQAEQAFADGKLAAFLSVEGAELLDCAVGRLDWAYARGVRFINLTWNHVKRPFRHVIADEPERGLSAAGKGRSSGVMEQLGMLLDVSHLSDAGFWDLAEDAQIAPSLPAIPIVRSVSFLIPGT